jgi:hypothetical protein
MVHVTDPLPRACCPSQLEHPLAVPAEQSLVEVKDDPGLFVFERVFDQGRQATCPSVTFGAAPPGIVDDDAHPEIADPDDRVCDLALPRIALVLHVKAALARENQIAQLLPRSLQMVAVHAGGDDEVSRALPSSTYTSMASFVVLLAMECGSSRTSPTIQQICTHPMRMIEAWSTLRPRCGKGERDLASIKPSSGA